MLRVSCTAARRVPRARPRGQNPTPKSVFQHGPVPGFTTPRRPGTCSTLALCGPLALDAASVGRAIDGKLDLGWKSIGSHIKTLAMRVRVFLQL